MQWRPPIAWIPPNRRPQAGRIVTPPPARTTPWHPAVVFVYGFALVILVGAMLLTLPVSSAAGRWTPFLDALFTATSAVCVTGLVVVNTASYWSSLGHVIILILFQVGGIGFMISATALILLSGRRATVRERVLLREALGGGEIGSVIALARNVIVFTVIAETVGTAVLTARFLQEMEPPQALWWGLFHAVSGFNNAGFDLFSDSLIGFSHDPVVLLTLAMLFVLGALSYTTVEDLAGRRRFGRLALDTKLVVVTSGLLAGIGTLALLFTERSNPATLGAMALGPRVLNAFFQATDANGRLQLRRHGRDDRGGPVRHDGPDVRWRLGGLDGRRGQGPDVQHSAVRDPLHRPWPGRRGCLPPAGAAEPGYAGPERRAALRRPRIRVLVRTQRGGAVCVSSRALRGGLGPRDRRLLDRHHRGDQPPGTRS